MSSMFNFIALPLGYLLKAIYELVSNYGLTIIIFTLIVKALILPLSVKQQKSMAETQRIQPLITALQEKYKYDKEKLNTEMQKIYQEHRINPLGGCLPLLIQFPIIIALYQVIVNPLRFMFGLSAEVISGLQAYFFPDATNLVQQIHVAQMITPDNVETVNQLYNIQIVPINFDFFGLNLGGTPSFTAISILWIIPIFAGLTSWLSAQTVSMQNKNNNAASSNAAANSTMKTMNTIMPLMSVMFTFSLPAGVGLYWIISNVAQIGQQLFLNHRMAKQNEGKPPLELPKETPTKSTKKKKR